jgi:phosphosulfolactate synthase
MKAYKGDGILMSPLEKRWIKSLCDPSAQRNEKPRQNGITMVMDKGLGIVHFRDILESCSPYIDYIKLGFGSAALYHPSLLEEKIRLAGLYDCTLYPGGTFFEVAYAQGKMDEYLDQVAGWSFEAVEISDGTVHVPSADRKRAIRKAKENGLRVITECGQKASGTKLDKKQVTNTLLSDMEAGAAYMILEGRESGCDVGLYDANGALDTTLLTVLQREMGDFIETLIWEAPQKNQQTCLISYLGANVNLGNIAPHEVFALESLRRGLRSDTFQQFDFLHHSRLPDKAMD